MSTVDTLAREHDLFRRLIGRLEKSLGYGEEAARRELRAVLLILLPALERHEDMEDAIFGRLPTKVEQGRRLAKQLALEHRQVACLRTEMAEALRQAWDFPFARVKEFVRRLATRLRGHFADEEQRLWPGLQEICSRSIEHSLEKTARRRLRRLERDVDSLSGMVSDYVGRDS